MAMSAPPKMAGVSTSLPSINPSDSRRSSTSTRAPMAGPVMVAVPPITTATRNSIECWKVRTGLVASAAPSIITDSEPATPA